MSAHTSGIWRATYRGVDQEANWASRIPYAIEVPVGSAVLPVADVCDQPEAEANARLIAAAPDLLRVAMDFQECLTEQCNLCECGEADCRTTRLRAAIAKATGEPA